ncbi:F-box DNA helicase 1 [Cololabis saira]|uniref:F-box DNA helicase 1 n=1 Tax=Cololabis saira TaxID=129043 RepID=UPI002AD2C438|nr:F-box DNA helicase 1 [Cololabis saira]
MEVAVKGKAKRKHLNPQDCDELGQSALTGAQPPHQGPGGRGPHQGLPPRTPNKRRKPGPAALGSPSGQQKVINHFFSVEKVISTSPHKSPKPSTSSLPMEEEEEDEDDDDVSLLAVPLASDFHTNVEQEDEIDDECLLAIEMAPHHEEKKDQEIDFLEGLTAEMFGNDDDFEELCMQSKEEEVEPLPDAHYGLLGTNTRLLQPQGCMDDLPEEVLRQVLSLVPARDIYCNVSLVCHQWKNIAQDPKFVPFKKRYYRYMMGEKQAELEILSILKRYKMTSSFHSQYSIQNVVIVMSKHKVGEFVRPERVLECVKKHRLYPQAEASVRLRFSGNHKPHNLGIEGPNPYAAMAVILVLSESVGDVQALVSLLSGCMSLTAVTEYLSHMATMLLALERNNVHISNRPHYNIYYVLHLLENGPFPVSSGPKGSSQLYLTGEQQQILSHNIKNDHVVKIIAFAGTGKTTTLVQYAQQRPHLRFLYVAFNNSVACEARQRFPRNVDCKTVHSLAYNDIGKRYQQHKKLAFSLRPFCINSVLPAGSGGFANAKVVATTLNNFLASADPSITTSHVPSHCVKKKMRVMINREDRQIYAGETEKIWNKMKCLKERSKQAYYMTHDGYLKLWQLQDPKPCLSDCYDAIFIDEAQDCTPAIMDVLLAQRCGKILVGDPHQQIYTFRGAVNALHLANHTHIFYLTQSFRFGPEIAYVAATILKVCKGVQKILVGGKQKDCVFSETAGRAVEAAQSGVNQNPGKIAILSRCNYGVFSQAVKLTDANPNCRIHFIGDVKNIGLQKVMDIYQLMTQQKKGTKSKAIVDPLVRGFSQKKENPFGAFKHYVALTEDKELDGKMKLVETFFSRIPELVARLYSCFESDVRKADFIVGTVHKAKGLEFDTVIITDDFACAPSSIHNLSDTSTFSFADIPSDEWNLVYVAVSRAKTCLVATTDLLRTLTFAREYFLRSRMLVSIETDGSPLQCCIPDCSNGITAGLPFMIYKQKMPCTNRETCGGPLCEKCAWKRIGPTAYLMADDVFSVMRRRRRQPSHNDIFPGHFIVYWGD